MNGPQVYWKAKVYHAILGWYYLLEDGRTHFDGPKDKKLRCCCVGDAIRRLSKNKYSQNDRTCKIIRVVVRKKPKKKLMGWRLRQTRAYDCVRYALDNISLYGKVGIVFGLLEQAQAYASKDDPSLYEIEEYWA